MPIRISAAFLRVGLVATLFSVSACGPTAGVRDGDAAAAAPGETLLGDADAALERGDYPAAARAYRESAQESDDETDAEQATRVAFDSFQFQEATLAARRWLELNPDQ